MNKGTRAELLGRLAEEIESIPIGHPLRIAVDGPPAAGKTILADELATVLRAKGHEVIRAWIEGFLLPRSQRYRRGEYSAAGCYEDSFDYPALHRVLLEPLGPHGDRRFKRAVYDKRADAELSERFSTASVGAVLLFDGVFLLRPELNHRWDLRIFVAASFEKTVQRARTRDLALYGSTAVVERRWRERYIPSQEHYFATVQPTDLADIIVANDEPLRPEWDVRPRRSLAQDSRDIERR